MSIVVIFFGGLLIAFVRIENDLNRNEASELDYNHNHNINSPVMNKTSRGRQECQSQVVKNGL
jgi:hypothetical protein